MRDDAHAAPRHDLGEGLELGRWMAHTRWCGGDGQARHLAAKHACGRAQGQYAAAHAGIGNQHLGPGRHCARDARNLNAADASPPICQLEAQHPRRVRRLLVVCRRERVRQ